MIPEGGLLRESPLTTLALVRLLASMNTAMHHKVLELSKALPAHVTPVRSLARVDPHVNSKIMITADRLSANVTYDFGAGMDLHVNPDGSFPEAGILAHLATILLLATSRIVRGSVKLKAATIGIRGQANVAGKGTFASMSDLVTI